MRTMAQTKQQDATSQAKSGLSRRQFIAGIGGIGVGAVLGGGIMALLLPNDVYAIEASQGYLLMDTKKCAGCETCAISCSLAHLGRINTSLSRIQIMKNPLGSFPTDDVMQNQCRQCPYPSCVEACPVGAMHCDPETGARMVTESKCIGCERCVEACPFTPSRVQWNFEDKCAQKCDLCKNTPFWDAEGGPRGKQLCVEVCPMKAISFTNELPAQTDEGYQINLRNQHYLEIGLPNDDDAKIPPATLGTATGGTAAQAAAGSNK